MFFPRSITIITVSTHNIFLERQKALRVSTLLKFQAHCVKFITLFICQELLYYTKHKLRYSLIISEPYYKQARLVALIKKIFLFYWFYH